MYALQPLIEEHQDKQLEQIPWKEAAYWFTPSGLLGYLSYMVQAHLPKDSTAHRGVGPPISISK